MCLLPFRKIGLILTNLQSFGKVPVSRLCCKMLVSAGDISLEQVLGIIFGILSGQLALCMLMLSRSFLAPSMLMVISSILGYDTVVR